ncbi:hypothetical protein DPMN_034571 [Dreissena polymorpha]|uniref:CMP/dCMP-type deaminase domain-containing protein n=1 Tax=Dreissena polymorpha TaxID=45954 RepID=A0A9D4M844_DREPO|nr:hypothetical protein DPMN_034571 [Dreissena polymorpha]
MAGLTGLEDATENLNIGPLVSLNDFKECFAHDGKYGDNAQNKWKSKTILIYKLGDNPFRKLENVPNMFGQVVSPGKHAEIVLIEKIQTEIENRRMRSQHPIHVKVEIYISYSPCHDCSNTIVNFIEKCNREWCIFDIKMNFSNFYKHYECLRNSAGQHVPVHNEGLRKLLLKRVMLQPVTGKEKWENFLSANGVPVQKQADRLAIASSQERITREVDDNNLFLKIYNSVFH